MNAESDFQIQSMAFKYEGFARFMQAKHGWSTNEYNQAISDFIEFEKSGEYQELENLFEAFDASQDDMQAFVNEKNPENLKFEEEKEKFEIFIEWHLHEKGWTQTKLAEKLGVSLSYVSILKNNPPKKLGDHIKNICTVFDVTIDDYNSFLFQKRRDELKILKAKKRLSNTPRYTRIVDKISAKKIGLFFETKRYEALLSYADVADQSGLTLSGIKKILLAQGKWPTDQSILKLCKIFNSTAQDIEAFNPETEAIILDSSVLRQFLIKKRQDMRLNQSEFSALIRMERAAYNRYESTSTKRFHMKTLISTCEGLGVTARDISDFGKQIGAVRQADKLPKPQQT